MGGGPAGGVGTDEKTRLSGVWADALPSAPWMLRDSHTSVPASGSPLPPPRRWLLHCGQEGAQGSRQ